MTGLIGKLTGNFQAISYRFGDVCTRPIGSFLPPLFLLDKKRTSWMTCVIRFSDLYILFLPIFLFCFCFSSKDKRNELDKRRDKSNCLESHFPCLDIFKDISVRFRSYRNEINSLVFVVCVTRTTMQ